MSKRKNSRKGGGLWERSSFHVYVVLFFVQE
jgi:hypothetical protein